MVQGNVRLGIIRSLDERLDFIYSFLLHVKFILWVFLGLHISGHVFTFSLFLSKKLLIILYYTELLLTLRIQLFYICSKNFQWSIFFQQNCNKISIHTSIMSSSASFYNKSGSHLLTSLSHINRKIHTTYITNWILDIFRL